MDRARVMSRVVAGTLAAVALIMPAAPAQAHGSVDQSFEGQVLGGLGLFVGREIAQTFTPAADTLTGVDLSLAGSADLLITIREGGPDGTVVGSANASFATGGVVEWTHFDFPSPVALTPGAIYAVRVAALNRNPSWTIGINGYSGGDAWICQPTCAPLSDSRDMWFRTRSNPVDATPPAIAVNVGGTLGDAGWYTSDVTIDWTVSDPESPDSLAVTGCVDQIITADQNPTDAPCSATSRGGATTATPVTVKRDATIPAVTWNGTITDGASYSVGDVPPAPSCTAADATSGPRDCVVTGYATSAGSHTLTATAHDNAGNEAVDTRTYTVSAAVWTLRGFEQPVDMGGVWNTVKGGSTLPLKFEVFAGTTELTDVAVVDSLITRAVACPVSGFIADDVELTSTGRTSLRYDSTEGRFVQNWQTPRTPGSCYTVTLRTDDGSSILAQFRLR